MIGRLLNFARALGAVPSLIEEQAALELQLDEVAQRLDHVAAIADELYIGGPRAADRSAGAER